MDTFRDGYFNGVDFVGRVFKEAPDPARREEALQLRDEFLKRVQTDGTDWIEGRLASLDDSIDSLRSRFQQAERDVSRAAYTVTKGTASNRPGEGAGWSGDAVLSSRYRRRVDKRDELRRQHRAARLRRAVLRVVRDEVSAYGVPEKETDPEEETTVDPLPRPTERYLRVAYDWLKAGNLPKGDKPTELWQRIREETGKSLKTIRQTFKRNGWYDPHTDPGTTPTNETVQAVLDEGSKRFS